MIQKIKINNFTVFECLEIELSKGFNLFIGENGTGKTHMLKLLRTILNSDTDTHSTNLLQYFNINDIAECVKDVEIDTTSISIYCSEVQFNLWFKGTEPYSSIHRNALGCIDKRYNSVLIPSKDMLTHSKGLPEMAEKYGVNLPFDKSLIDIITIARRWGLAEIPDIGKAILPKIERIIGGKVIVSDEVFYIQQSEGRLINFALLSEGLKKVALIWQLIMNESITEGTVLFWDEVDANLNPKLFREVVEILLELSRNGVQLFITTHNYVLSKYVEVLMEETDSVLFHSLYRENNQILCESADSYSGLTNNAIRKENIKLYEAEMEQEAFR